MFDMIIGTVLKPVLSVIDKLVPDKDLAAKLKAEASLEALKLDYSEFSALIDARAKVLNAEYEHGSWLSKNWRPLVMLTFTYIIMHNYILSPSFGIMPLEMPPQMFSLIENGLTGYIIGRSAEKIVPEAIKVFKGGK